MEKITQETDFVKLKMNHLVVLFPEIKSRYQYDENSFTHFIEIIPESYFLTNGIYSAFETSIIEEFYYKFPNSSICFISRDSLFEITTPNYSVQGIAHGVVEEFSDAKLSSVQWIDLLNFQTLSDIGNPYWNFNPVTYNNEIEIIQSEVFFDRNVKVIEGIISPLTNYNAIEKWWNLTFNQECKIELDLDFITEQDYHKAA